MAFWIDWRDAIQSDKEECSFKSLRSEICRCHPTAPFMNVHNVWDQLRLLTKWQHWVFVIVNLVLPDGDVAVFRVVIAGERRCWLIRSTATKNNSKLFKCFTNCCQSERHLTVQKTFTTIVDEWPFASGVGSKIIDWNFVFLQEVDPIFRLISLIDTATRKANAVGHEACLFSSFECQHLRDDILWWFMMSKG